MKRRILSITVIFFLLTAITVYSSSLITSREESEVSLSFTTEEYLADYDKLWEILDENYFYFPYLEKHGVTIEALKADTRRQLESRIHDTEGFYYLLEIMFRKMHNFAHLGVVDTAVYATYQKYYAAETVPDNGWKKFCKIHRHRPSMPVWKKPAHQKQYRKLTMIFYRILRHHMMKSKMP